MVICLRIGKNLMAKTLSGDFLVTTPETPLLSQQAITSKGISSTLPTYSWTLTPIPNWTCSVVTIPLSNAWLPSMWLTVVRVPIRDFKYQLRRLSAAKFFSSSTRWRSRRYFVTNPIVQIHRNFFKRNRWTRSRISSPVTICLNRVCSMLVQLVNYLTALKTIILYV